jgi:hypothetical protein
MKTESLLFKAKPEPKHDKDLEVCVACSKCGGSGFWCKYVENGVPKSSTGFDCYACGGTGWHIFPKDSADACRATLPGLDRLTVSGSEEVVEEQDDETMTFLYKVGDWMSWAVPILPQPGKFKVFLEGPSCNPGTGTTVTGFQQAITHAKFLVGRQTVVQLDRYATKPSMEQEKVQYHAMTDAELKEYFAEKLRTSSAWVRRALIAIYKYQTEDEKVVGETKHHNGVGFTGADANILSSFARKLMENERYILSPKQLEIAHKKLPKYAGQLVRIVRSRQ